MGSKLRILRNGILYTSIGVGTIYAWDQTFNRRSLSRTAYALYNASLMAVDYKVSFREGSNIDALHERNAQRLYKVITHNKGLYVKIGQSIAVQGNMLPAPYRRLLSQLFDDAPQDTWDECEKTLRHELGQDPSNVFSEINHTAVASASIAQVHQARLKASGEIVALKIQHADIPKSAYWDLATYKMLSWVFDKFVFDMPMYFIARYIAEQVREETNFRTELKNSQRMRTLVMEDKETKDKVYVPRVFPALSSERMLVMEWIDGVSLNHRDEVEAQGFNVKDALTSVFKILTKEAFEWGVVHSDPHPGNWILRRHPNNKYHQQLIMLDHGLYVYMSEELRLQYFQLWRAMFNKDLPKITEITEKWGFGDPKLFASATMMQPYDDDDFAKSHSNFHAQEAQARRAREFLKDTSKIPLSLVFVGRTQRILQNLNQIYGSPVNRMRILVEEVLKIPSSPIELRGDWRSPWITRVLDWAHRRMLLLQADLIFMFLRIKQYITKEDPEAYLEQAMEKNGKALLK